MNHLRKPIFVFFLCSLFLPKLALSLEAKYLPGIETLRTNHGYIQKAKAPTYWRVSPFYIAQRNKSACSIASASIIINAARNLNPILAEEALVTQNEILHTLKIEAWIEATKPKGIGTTLDQFATYLGQALNKYGMTYLHLKTVHINEQGPQSLHQFTNDLLNMEAGNAFILANFDLSQISAQETGGHISPLGAFDAKHKKILVMDVYRYTFEPYWVPLERLLTSMNTKDSVTGKNRGYVVVSIR